MKRPVHSLVFFPPNQTTIPSPGDQTHAREVTSLKVIHSNHLSAQLAQ